MIGDTSICEDCAEPIVRDPVNNLWVLARGHQPKGRPIATCHKSPTNTHRPSQSAEDGIRRAYENRW